MNRYDTVYYSRGISSCPFSMFCSSFLLGTNESHELAEIKRLLNEVNTHLDSVEIHLQDIQRNIKWTQIKS